MKRLIPVLILVFLTAPVACADQPATQPADGVTYRHIVQANPPLHLHVVIADLTNPRVHIQVSRGGTDKNLVAPWEVTLMRVTEIADRDNLVAAVNANMFEGKDSHWILGREDPYFDGNWARTAGFAMSDGVLFSANPMTPTNPCLVVDGKGKITIAQFKHLPADARQIVSGAWQIIKNGKIVIPIPAPPGIDADPIPRTAVGIDRDGKTFYMLVVDGRRPDYSLGMNLDDFAAEMLKLGAFQAITLDSGGSSTMVIRNPQGKAQLVNRPSDGHDFLFDLSRERAVANAIGVVVDAPPENK